MTGVGGQPTRVQQQLASQLSQLRGLAGIDQRQMAHSVGVSQATISRFERATRLPTLPNIVAWATACSANPDTLEQLTALTEAAHAQVESWRDLVPRSPQLQDAVRSNETTAGVLRNYSPITVPGLLQTADYARRALELTDYSGQQDIPAAVEARLRRQEALHDPTRQFEFLIPEQALRWSLGPPVNELAQLDRVASLASLTNVTAGLLPNDGSAPTLPLHSFVIYDDRGEEEPFVAVEMVHGYATVTEPADVAMYRDLFTKLMKTARTGSDAAELLRHISSDLTDR